MNQKESAPSAELFEGKGTITKRTGRNNYGTSTPDCCREIKFGEEIIR